MFLVVTGMLGKIPAPILSSEYWNDIDASTFRIRGRKYIDDKVKIVSAPAVFKLLAIDVSILNVILDIFFSDLYHISFVLLIPHYSALTDFQFASTYIQHCLSSPE